MGIPYASEEALDLIDKIGHVLSNTAAETSIRLAKDLGPYPAWNPSITKEPRRNYTCTTIAPTGTLSKFARCSPGIEPVYDWHMEIFTEQGTYVYDYPFMDEVIRNGRQGDTALRIPIKWHIAHQAAWQRWIDNAVSKTINLPAEATVEEVRCAFEEAYRTGCKGITVYRDRSRDEQVLSHGKQAERFRRPHVFTCRNGRLYEVASGCGKMFIWIDEVDGKQHEVFVVSSGGCTANNESTGRILSDEMQRGVPIDDITRPLKKVKCINAMKNPNAEGNSCSDIIGKVIDEDYSMYYKTPEEIVVKLAADRCPSCGAAIVLTGGCSTGMCMACGWSGCS
jgi:ribonucleoside-diphosphate reductase alpha chain